MKLTRQTIHESIEEYKAPNTDANNGVSLIEEDDEDTKALPDAELDKPIVVSTEIDQESETKDETDDSTKDDEADEDLKNGAICSTINSFLNEKFNEIDGIKSLIATIGYEFPEGGKDDIVGILNSVLDDCNIHIGVYQKALAELDPESQIAIEKGKDKAEDIIADAHGEADEADGKEGDSEKEEDEEDEEDGKEKQDKED